MQDIWLLLTGLVLLAAQVVCLFAKKMLVRLMPVFLAVALMVFCVIMCVVSGFTNWGYLILLYLLAGLLGAMGLVWLIYGIARVVRKIAK